MTRTRLVALTIIALGFASGAFAQTVDDAYSILKSPPRIVLMDPLDPVSRAALLAMRGNGGGMAIPTTTPDLVATIPPPSPRPAAPAAQPTRAGVGGPPAGPALSASMSTSPRRMP